MSMSDKPKTLHEQLMELAEWITTVGHSCSSRGETALAEGCWRKAAEVRAMAERVKGKVFVKPEIRRSPAITEEMNVPAYGLRAHLPLRWGSVESTPEEAVTSLQDAIDRLEGACTHAPTS